MRHAGETNLTAVLSKDLIRAMKDVALDQDWSLRETHERALVAFIEAWRDGRTSGTYHGVPPGGRHRTVWVARDIRDAIHAIHKQHGMRISQVIQEAFAAFCEKMGRPAPIEYPPLPSGKEPIRKDNR